MVVNKRTFVTIQQQTIGTAGTLLFDLVNKNELLGSPIAKASSITSTTTSGNILAVLGDFSQFIVYDRIGVSLEFVQNVVDGDGNPGLHVAPGFGKGACRRRHRSRPSGFVRFDLRRDLHRIFRRAFGGTARDSASHQRSGDG